jgi:hypothetical protein
MHTRLTVLYHPAQRGAALVVSMVMLLVITVIGIAVMGGSRLEWLMANNSHFQTDAYRNAEIALVQGLATIGNPPTLLPYISAPSTPSPPQDLADITKWNDGTVVSVPVTPTPPTGSGAYVKEYLGCSEYINPAPSPPYYLQFVPITAPGNCTGSTNIIAYTYRVWALGTDGKGAARILQATRSLIYNNGAPVQASQPTWLQYATPLPSLDNRVEFPSS